MLTPKPLLWSVHIQVSYFVPQETYSTFAWIVHYFRAKQNKYRARILCHEKRFWVLSLELWRWYAFRFTKLENMLWYTNIQFQYISGVWRLTMVSNLCAKKLVHSAKVLYDVEDLTAFFPPPLEFFCASAWVHCGGRNFVKSYPRY